MSLPSPLRLTGRENLPFASALFGMTGIFVLLIVSLLVANLMFVEGRHVRAVFESEEIMAAVKLSLVTCTITALLSVLVAIPAGYVLARVPFRGRVIVDALVDVPIVLPPIVVGLALLLLFNQTDIGRWFESVISAVLAWLDRLMPAVMDWLGLGGPARRGLTHDVPGVILAQFAVSSAFAIRTMRVAFEQVDDRRERVALVLGCTRRQAFQWVVLPEVRRGTLAAGTLAWARAMGEFGPILVFAGSTRMKTEVLPTTVFLEMSVGNIEAAATVSLLMVAAAMVVLLGARAAGARVGV
ncbi:MAG: ABC transporter permease [Phycisphaerales bacterium]|nr:ABC transporter permease [Phycisphaerales bacterium]